ncbi:MAG TPA: hypothetical protein VN207_11535 [Ktedonobacteraceae bacterium]|nr:hypothetical protein [Ktedonobacteraceae bacterium]
MLCSQSIAACLVPHARRATPPHARRMLQVRVTHLLAIIHE